MNRDQIKGKAREIKGDVKERIGGATKDRSTQAEGWAENKTGKIQRGVGDLEEDIARKERKEPE